MKTTDEKKKYLNQYYHYLKEQLEFSIKEEPEPIYEESDRFKYRAAVVQGFYNAAEAFTHYIKQNYPEELRTQKDDHFPLEWMRKPRIKEMTDRCPSFYPILNYIFRRNRYWRGTDLKKMIDQADKLIEGRRYLKREKHYYSTFQGNDDFYTELSNQTSTSKSTCKRYIGAFVKMGILKILYKGRNDGFLYADGYFAPYGDQIRKHSFLKQDAPLIKDKLKTLPELVSTYKRKPSDK